MPKVKTARSYQGVTLVKGCAVVLSPIAVVVLAHLLFPAWELSNVVGGVVIALPLLFGLILSRNTGWFRGHSFVCPDCRRGIDKPLENSGADREAVLYFCEPCDVLWHAGNTNTDW